MSNYVTPNRLSLYCSIGITAILFFMLLILDISYAKTFVVCAITFGCSFLIISSAVQKFFTERIKLIYKFISNKKDNYREEAFRKLVLPKTSLLDLENDVEIWATEQTEKEEQIALLKENENFRKDFLANFGHEIKTPIFSVQGYIHTLKDGAINDLNVRDKFIENAQKGIDRLAILTKDLDTISNLESGKIHLEIEKFNLHDVIIDIIDEITFVENPKQISIKLLDASTAQINVHADKQRISQVITNLIENAIKYGNNNGFVHISVFEIDKHTALIEVSDNGIGMETAEIDRIFERFYRTNSGRNKNKTGSGIGLALVKHILEAHQQKITCRSTPNVGSTFGFTLDRENKIV